MPEVKILAGTYAEYVNIETKSDSALYFCDNGQLYKGTTLYSDQIEVVEAIPANPVSGKIYINTTNNSVTYYNGDIPVTVVSEIVNAINDSTNDNNLANVKAIKDFIKAQINKIPAATDYTIILEDTTAGENELTKQILKQGESGKETEVGTISVPKLVMDTSVTENDMAATYKFIYGGVEVGKVNIPKDLVVTQDGSEIIRVDDDHPVSGLNNGVYLKLMIQNSANPVYIDVKDLGGTYTGKIVTNGISVSISDANEISAALVGKAVSESNLSDELTKKINSQSDWEQTDTTAYDYIKNKPTFNELTKADIETMLGLSPEELEGLASLINDNEIRTDKVWSSSKTYTELQKIAASAKSAYDIAVKNGFKGTEEEWLESLFPSIDPTTKHWIIDGVDSGVVAEGKSIKSITSDESKNIIVTFTDGTTQNIGKLTVNIQGDFLTEGGFGNLRYYNGHFQYYDTATSAWVDTSVTPDNVCVINMMPQSMKKMLGCYDTEINKYKLKFEEPDDTVIDGQAFCIVEKVVIRRKLGSVPANENDGDLVTEIKRSEFGTYKDKYYVDAALTANIDDVYYYKAFPMSTTGFYNTSNLNETLGIKCKDYNLYGFKLDQNESDPASMITYLSDCDNAIYKSAYMDYTADTFNYGDWDDAWFIKKLKPCMLKYDGTVDYELDKNDYAKKADGTASDVANTAYEGNAMVGIPKIYWKIVDNGDNTVNVYFCDKKLDADFHCWSHIDNNGNEIDYCYVPCYNGYNDGTRLRSLSGVSMNQSVTISTEISLAKSNNINNLDIWNIELFNDRQMINLLLLLIGKNTNTQHIFGYGIYNTSERSLTTGSLNSNGMFYGQNTSSPVKIFGIENYYGAKWRRHLGCVLVGNTQKIKLTYGTQDGTSIDGYNTTGDGYITINNSSISGTSNGYLSQMKFTTFGLIPSVIEGSSTTYYCDGILYNTSGTKICAYGGYSGSGEIVGAFLCGLHTTVSGVDWAYNASVSCKPLAPTP